MPIDVELLQAIFQVSSDVVVDPAQWPEFLGQISKACGGIAAVLLPYTGSQGVSVNSGARDLLDAYVNEGWCDGDRDPRKRAFPIQLRGEVAIDADVISSDEMRRSPFYNELLPRFDAKWWAGIGFQGEGSERWCLALQRSPRQGEFKHSDKRILQHLSARLTEIVRLSYVAGRATLSEVASSFDRIRQAVIAINDMGRVIRANASADRLFGDAIRVSNGQLLIRDSKAAKEYEELLSRIRWTTPGKSLRSTPIVVNRKNADPLLIEALPIDGAARAPFLHARALLLLKPVTKPARPDWPLLAEIFGLTPAEARLAARLATGEALEQAADELAITKATARNQLQSVFRKTDVNRQAELVALLSSLRLSSPLRSS